MLTHLGKYVIIAWLATFYIVLNLISEEISPIDLKVDGWKVWLRGRYILNTGENTIVLRNDVFIQGNQIQGSWLCANINTIDTLRDGMGLAIGLNLREVGNGVDRGQFTKLTEKAWVTLTCYWSLSAEVLV